MDRKKKTLISFHSTNNRNFPLFLSLSLSHICTHSYRLFCDKTIDFRYVMGDPCKLRNAVLNSYEFDPKNCRAFLPLQNGNEDNGRNRKGSSRWEKLIKGPQARVL